MGNDCVRNWSESLTTLEFNPSENGDALALGGEGGVGSRNVPFANEMLNYFVTIIIHVVLMLPTATYNYYVGPIHLLHQMHVKRSRSELSLRQKTACNLHSTKRTPALKSVVAVLTYPHPRHLHAMFCTMESLLQRWNSIHNSHLPQCTIP